METSLVIQGPSRILFLVSIRSISTSNRNGAKSYYDVLGVGKTASFEEIKRAYFERSKLLHPDRNNGNTGDFMALKKAYDVLRRPADRRAYDMGLSGVPPPPSSYGRRRGKEAFYNVQYEAYWNPRSNSPDFEAFKKRHEEMRRSWRNIVYFTSAVAAFVVMYNFVIWYEISQQEHRLDRLIAKDEIAKCYMRQRELSGQNEDKLLVDYYARLLHSDIEDAQKRRDEERRISGEHNSREIREEYRWLQAVQSPLRNKQFKTRNE